jgi:hypothetical protein
MSLLIWPGWHWKNSVSILSVSKLMNRIRQFQRDLTGLESRTCRHASPPHIHRAPSVFIRAAAGP